MCKHCGCMLNTDYVYKSSSSEKIDPHADQKQEINFVWPNTEFPQLCVSTSAVSSFTCTVSDASSALNDATCTFSPLLSSSTL